MTSTYVHRALVALAAHRSERARFGGCNVQRCAKSTLISKTKSWTTTVFATASVSVVDRLDLTDYTEEDVRDLVPEAWREDDTTGLSAIHGMASDEDNQSKSNGPIDLQKASDEKNKTFRKSSRSKLTPSDVGRFRGDTLFDRVARVVCNAAVLPRKELFETWAAAEVITETFGDRLGAEKPRTEKIKNEKKYENHTRVLDLAGGHGFLALCLLLLNPLSTSALIVDRRKPDSFEKLYGQIVTAFPELHGRVRFEESSIANVLRDENENVLLVSVHACGTLTDLILQIATDTKSPVAVVPCCHNALGGAKRFAKQLDNAVPAPVALDVARLELLRLSGFEVSAKTIPREITQQNRVILGAFSEIKRKGSEAGRSEKQVAQVSPGWPSVAKSLPHSPWKRYLQ